MTVLNGTVNADKLGPFLGISFTVDQKFYVYGYGGDDFLWGGRFGYVTVCYEFPFPTCVANKGVPPSYLYGGAGNDVLLGFSGSWLEGGSGADTLIDITGVLGASISSAAYASSPDSVSINLALGKASGGDAEGDKLIGINGIIGSDFADVLIGNSRNNKLDGGAGNDSLAGGIGKDTLLGGIGDDTLEGGVGDDDIFGMDGDDTLVGGDGNDRVNGGAGNDIFQFIGDNGLDRVDDFEDGIDFIDLASYGVSEIGVDFSVTQVGDDVLISDYSTAGGTITLLDTDVSVIDETDFIFA